MILILNDLKESLGADVVHSGAEADPRFWRDWTSQNDVVPIAVVLPKTSKEVSKTLRLCNDAGVPVVPQGGRTGLVGGAQPEATGIVLSLERMATVPVIDRSARVAVVQAGVTLETLQMAAGVDDLAFPVDFGARGSCQIGGIIATNAGGNRAFREGMVRANVLGLEVVLPDGTIVDAMNRFLKNNTGYDTKQLFIGSEGTLGVVTGAVLRLVKAAPAKASALLNVADIATASVVLEKCEDTITNLSVCDVMWPDYYRYARDLTGINPLGDGADVRIVLLIEAQNTNNDALVSEFTSAVETLFKVGLVQDGVVAQSESQRQSFWALREANAALFSRYPLVQAFDVSVVPDNMTRLVEQVSIVVCAIDPNLETLWFGHLGDNNLHLVVVGNSTNSEYPGRIQSSVYEQVRTVSGSVSAEHGIGRDKLPYLSFTRTKTEIALMQNIKQAIDPRGIMNPGKVVP